MGLDRCSAAWCGLVFLPPLSGDLPISWHHLDRPADHLFSAAVGWKDGHFRYFPPFIKKDQLCHALYRSAGHHNGQPAGQIPARRPLASGGKIWLFKDKRDLNQKDHPGDGDREPVAAVFCRCGWGGCASRLQQRSRLPVCEDSYVLPQLPRSSRLPSLWCGWWACWSLNIFSSESRRSSFVIFF